MTNGRTRRVLCAAALLGTMLATPVIGNDEGQKKGGTGGTPGFSGTWTLDPLKSDQAGGRRGGGGGGGGEIFTLEQSGDDIVIRRGPQVIRYKLDGSESVNSVAGPGGSITMRSKARWDGSDLVIETVRDQPGGTVTSKEVRSLSADGKEMTVETTSSTPLGERTSKRIYNKGQ